MKENPCKVGFLPVGRFCTDIDECSELPDLCRGDLDCTNTPGSYQCGCRHGYETITINSSVLVMNSTVCTDIDECTNQDLCPDNSFCLNTPGNFTCECRTGFEGRLCTDIDECSLGGQCHTNSTCSNSDGSYTCSCDVGYHGDGLSCVPGQCDDSSCPNNQKCVSPSASTCECKEGFRFDEVKDSCQDVDECLLGYCGDNSICVNSVGSFSCSCSSGYFGDGKVCQKGNCTDDICAMNEECVSSTTLDCHCKPGFERNVTDFCVDTDECSNSKNKCDANATCSNVIGAYTCSCNSGFSGDGFSCEDINECENGLHDCHADANCVNTIGNFTCPCNNGYLCRPLWILVLNRLYGDEEEEETAPLMIDGQGQSKKIELSNKVKIPYDSTIIDESCSITWQGKMYIFGGYPKETRQQILVVDKCKLTLKGKLPFKMIAGACAQRENAEVFICFENIYRIETLRNCHRATDPLKKFSKLPNSTYYHEDTSIAVTSGKQAK